MPVSSQSRAAPAGEPGSLTARLGSLALIARAAWASSRSDLLQQVASATRDVLDVASLSISQLEPETNQIRTLVNFGTLGLREVPEPVDETYPIPSFGSLRATVQELHGWRLSVDEGSDADPDVELLRALGKHCSVGVPIPLDGRVWGELYLTRTADQPCFAEADIDFAQVVAVQIGAALATRDHLDHVDRLAHTDPLTGLANRRSVDEALEAAFARHKADGTQVGLVVCDLNGLKRINDEQGHDAGDRALVRFAELLSTSASRLREPLVARLGGDEFCVVVAESSSDEVVSVAEEICKRVLRSPLEGVSCGVAATDDDVGDIDEPSRLFRLADAAQYRAKRGRAAVPVVAGRSLPAEVIDHLDHLSVQIGAERRAFRGREMSDTTRILRTGVEMLDQSRTATVQARLANVADHLSERVDAVGWALSVATSGSDIVKTCQFVTHRQRAGKEMADEFATEFSLGDYPGTEAVMAGGVVHLVADDPETDPAEAQIMRRMGATSLVMAGSESDADSRWLIEIYLDEHSSSLIDVTMLLRALMTIAIHEAR